MDTTVPNAPIFPVTDVADPDRSYAPANKHASIDKVASGAHAVVDRAAKTAKPAVDRAAGLAHRTVDKAAGAVVPAADWINEKAQDVLATPKKLVDGTRSHVSSHPLKAVGIAALVGFLVGRLAF
jgi:ElaB/YqjD/DUF883 family membrane-anchored ribosome-binding protein